MASSLTTIPRRLLSAQALKGVKMEPADTRGGGGGGVRLGHTKNEIVCGNVSFSLFSTFTLKLEDKHAHRERRLIILYKSPKTNQIKSNLFNPRHI